MSIITLVGAGQMAAALTFPAFENGHEVRLVGTPLDSAVIERLRSDNYHMNLDRTLHEGVRYYTIDEVKEAISGADLVVCGVSSFGVEWFGETILPLIPEDIPMVSVTKGMIDHEDGSMETYLDYWQRQLPENSKLSINGIGGPCTARQLSDHDYSFVAYCGHDMETLRFIRSLFSTDYYIISLSTDIPGVECAVALKNGYAMGVAMAIGMGEKASEGAAGNFNAQAALFQQSDKEMRTLLTFVGGNPASLMFGVGDLYVTVTGGRSRKVGVLLGKGYSIEEATEMLAGETLEAVVIATRTARAVKALAATGKADLKDFPLLMHVDALLNQGERINIPWKSFETETVI